jgi:hypothetical protein
MKADLACFTLFFCMQHKIHYRTYKAGRFSAIFHFIQNLICTRYVDNIIKGDIIIAMISLTSKM